MIVSAQFTIISLCDVVTSDTPPENPYEGQLWVDTSVTPPETKIWDGNEWVVQNDIETIRTTISILTEKDAQFQQTIDGLNSYVATLTETVETVSNDQGVLEERVLNSESRVSELEHTVDGLSVTMQEQYIGGINYVQNSSGLNGITDDWSYSGTVKTDASTDTQNNTISDSCFVLGAYSSLSQYIRGVVPGTYTISVRAKKASTMSGYFYVTYNGNKTKYLFNKSTAFDWTDYSVTLTHLLLLSGCVHLSRRHHDLRRGDPPKVDTRTQRNLHAGGQDRQAGHRGIQQRIVPADGYHEHGVRRLLQR